MGARTDGLGRLGDPPDGGGDADWPGSALTLPAMPVWGILSVAAGMLWLRLWRWRWRFLGVAAVVVGMAGIALPERPDVLINDDGGTAD